MAVTLAIQNRTASGTSALVRPLVLWHLVSLDAPTVAVVWTAAAARSAGVRAGTSLLLAMFVAVWVLYAADRLLDSSASGEGELEARHRFHSRHRRWFFPLLALSAGALGALVPRLPGAMLRGELALATLLAAWLLLIHLPPRRRVLPKEVALGFFFAAATFLPAAAAPHRESPWLPVTAVCFAALCSLNCFYIFRWEHPDSPAHARAHPSTAWALRHLRVLSWLLILGPGVLAVVSGSGLLAAVALSAALLALLDRFRPHDATVLRACADLVLLTPMLLWR